MTAPAQDTFRRRRHSRLLYHFRGDRFDLATLDGRQATFSRAATAAPLDVNGTARTVQHHQPAWQIVDWDGDATRETPGLLLGASDEIYWSHLGVARNLTIYVEFVENGTKGIASAALFYVGNAGNTGARLWIDATGTQYRINHHNGTTLVTATMSGTAPVNGQRVALRATLGAAGAVQIHQSINGAAETSSSTSGTNTLPTTAFGDRIYLGSTGTTNKGNAIIVRARVAAGTKTAAQMQLGW